MVFKSRYSDVEIPDISVHGALFAMMEMHGDKTAVVNGVTGKRYTFNEVVECSKKIASGLAKLGVKKGDIVAFYSPNVPEYCLMFFACWANGAAVTTVNPTYTAYELSHHLQDSGATWLFAHNDFIDNVKTACHEYRNIKRTILLEPGPGSISVTELLQDDGKAYDPEIPIDPRKDLAVIPYSSGTTGLPKGVIITHYNIIANLSQIAHSDIRTPESQEENFTPVTLAFLPFFHAYGMVAIFLGSMAGGGTIVTIPRFEPRLFLGTIEKYKITGLALVPPIVIFLTKSPLVKEYDLSSVIRAGSGAAPLKKDTQLQFEKQMNLPEMVNGWGMTETTCVGSTPGHVMPKKPGSVGSLLPLMEGRIVDPDTGKDLGPNKRGELWVRGPNIMMGYLNQTEATKDSIREGGWLTTGDVAYYDEEDYVFIVDRMKELIKYKGFQVPPAELEALMLNHPDVTDVGVVGIPDEQAGELPRAYVVPREGSGITEKQLIDYATERSAPYKHLRGGLHFVKEVPKSLSGKILRRKLREIALREQTKSKL